MAEPVSLRVVGGEKLAKRFERLASAMQTEAKELVATTALGITQTAQEHVTVDRGDLRRSIIPQPLEGGFAYKVSVGKNYGTAIEFGRKPGGKLPPPQALEIWGQRKLGVKGLGFILAWNIKKHGTQAQPFFFPSVDSWEKYFQRNARALDVRVLGK